MIDILNKDSNCIQNCPKPINVSKKETKFVLHTKRHFPKTFTSYPGYTKIYKCTKTPPQKKKKCIPDNYQRYLNSIQNSLNLSIKQKPETKLISYIDRHFRKIVKPYSKYSKAYKCIKNRKRNLYDI